MLKYFTLSYILLLMAVLVGADLGLLSPLFNQIHHIPFGDKTCHFVLIGILSFLLCTTLSMHQRRRRKRTIVFATIAVVAIVTSMEEFSQSMLATRRFSEFDMACNVAGACVFGLFAFLVPTGRGRTRERRIKVSV